MSKMASVIVTNYKFVQWYLGYNAIKDEGMIMILEHLKNKLTRLNLCTSIFYKEKCGITYVGIQTAINYNLSNLKKLYLSH